MMLRFVTVLYLLGGSLAQDYGCRQKNHEQCEEPRSMGHFPETKEEVDNLCRQGISYLKCMYNGSKKCDDIEDLEILQLKGFIIYMETELCNENSHLYGTIFSNLPCVGETLPKIGASCSGAKLEEMKQTITSAIGNPFLGDHDTHPENMQSCVHVLSKIACGTMLFEESCGEDVGEAFTNVAVHLDPYFGSCPPEVLRQLPNAINALRSSVKAEEEAVNAIKRRK